MNMNINSFKSNTTKFHYLISILTLFVILIIVNPLSLSAEEKKKYSLGIIASYEFPSLSADYDKTYTEADGDTFYKKDALVDDEYITEPSGGYSIGLLGEYDLYHFNTWGNTAVRFTPVVGLKYTYIDWYENRYSSGYDMFGGSWSLSYSGETWYSLSYLSIPAGIRGYLDMDGFSLFIGLSVFYSISIAETTYKNEESFNSEQTGYTTVDVSESVNVKKRFPNDFGYIIEYGLCFNYSDDLRFSLGLKILRGLNKMTINDDVTFQQSGGFSFDIGASYYLF